MIVSYLPHLFLITDKQLVDIEFSDKDSKNTIHDQQRTWPHAAHPWWSIFVPLDLIFRNIIQTVIYPDQWKQANVTTIHKKDDKQKIKNYRSIFLLPICAKLFERMLFNNIYNYLISNNLITTNQSGFKRGDSTTNQLLSYPHYSLFIWFKHVMWSSSCIFRYVQSIW